MSFHSDQRDLDLEVLRDVLRHHPVRLAVLFGSHATEETHPQSDIDIAVEFTDSVESVTDVFLSLVADLSSGAERNDIDVSLVSDLKPRVGRSAFSDGILLVGSEDRMELHRDRFERDVAELERTEPSLRERFDTVIEDIDRVLAEQS